MEPVERLEMRGVSRSFGGTAALHNFSIEIPGGAFVTLLGPSGCGKSTALNCLAGLLDLTAGEIFLNGRPIHQVPAEKRGFGMVFQNYALFPHLTVTRNVSYGLELLPMPSSERSRRVRQALDLVHLDIDIFGKRFPAQLSGGQQQRLAIARTIVLEPSLLLLDEPLSNLDAKLRGEMRIEIKRLHKQLGLTTIYVTHDQSEAMSLSDIVVVMRQGAIEQIGTPQEIYNSPKRLYVADFMGYSNRLPVEVQGRDGELWVVQTADGTQLRASVTTQPQEDWQPGKIVLACARPDETLVDPPSTFNQLRGIVHLTEYIGKGFETVISVEGDEKLQFVASSERPRDLETSVKFGVRPDRLLLFPADGPLQFAVRRETAVPVGEKG
jgi:putative spermidine/putrescine transport system ATP-binding protein